MRKCPLTTPSPQRPAHTTATAMHHTRATNGQRRQALRGPSTTATAAPALTGTAPTHRRALVIRAALRTAGTRRQPKSPSVSASNTHGTARSRPQSGPGSKGARHEPPRKNTPRQASAHPRLRGARMTAVLTTANELASIIERALAAAPRPPAPAHPQRTHARM